MRVLTNDERHHRDSCCDRRTVTVCPIIKNKDIKEARSDQINAVAIVDGNQGAVIRVIQHTVSMVDI